MIEENREAPEERSIVARAVLSPLMSEAQMNLVLNKTPNYAIKSRPGPGGVYKYVKHGYVTDTMNKIFGFDWDLVVTPMSDGKMYALEVEELPEFKGKIQVGVRKVRHLAVCGYIEARIRDEHGNLRGTIKKSGFGSQLWLPSQELGDALKGAKSDLLKVCAMGIGVALDLYWNDEAEIEAFEKRQDEFIRSGMGNVVEGKVVEKENPSNYIELLSMSMKKYGIDGKKVDEITKKDSAFMFSATEEDILVCWLEIKREFEK